MDPLPTTTDFSEIVKYQSEQRSAFLLRYFLPFYGVLLVISFLYSGAQAMTDGVQPDRPIAILASLLMAGTAYFFLWRKQITWTVSIFLTNLALLFAVLILDTPDKGHAAAFIFLLLIALAILQPRQGAIVVATSVISFLIIVLPQFEPAFQCSFLDMLKGIGGIWILSGFLLAVIQADRPLLENLAFLAVANERAKQVEEIKDSFISSVNHEIRNPVTAMLGYLEILRLSANRATPERRLELIDEATQAGIELRQLLQSILDARRLDQTAEDFEPEIVDVREAIEGALKLLDPRDGALADHPLQIAVVRGLKVYGDKVRLQQVLSNLISNAMKYSPKGAPIEVTGQFAGEERELTARWGRKFYYEARVARLTVRDFGLGVPPEQAPLLFQKFVRLPRDLASTVIGTGLGLYLCRSFVEAMEGQIWLESEGIEGEGTKFFIHLPLPPSPFATPAKPEPNKQDESFKDEIALLKERQKLAAGKP